MNRTMFPTRMLVLFAMLSAADFALTWHLLTRGGGFYESNPVAGWWLAKFGWSGLALFKLGAVIVAGGLAAIVSVRRPRAARNLLAFGCAAVGLVVGYSAALANGARLSPDVVESREVARCDATNRDLEGQLRRNLEFRELLNALSTDVVNGKLTLPAAIDRLSTSSQVGDASWNRGLVFAYPELDLRGKMAAIIVQNSLRLPQLFPSAIRVLDRLRGELKDVCGREVPLDIESMPAVADTYSGEPKSGGA